MANNAAVLLIDTRQKAGNVDEGDDWNVECVAGAHEACCFFAGLDVEHAGQDHWLVANDAYRLTIEPGKTADDAFCPVWEVFEELAVVHHFGNDLLHVVRLVR